MSQLGIVSCKIYPGVGIARLGNSPDDFFIGPEAPGRPPAPANGLFKDAAHRVKRQAARFRVYAFYETGDVKEITAADADITWTVHLANKKGSWLQFVGERRAAELGGQRKFRNATVADRGTLEIDPGPRSISGVGAKGDNAYRFDGGTFLGVPVSLGELQTDEAGRLLVLGGAGRSDSTPLAQSDNPIRNYANNDNWFDDTSDGPVTAKVVFRDTNRTTFEATPARVLVTPPKFTPHAYNLVTLYDVMEEVAFNHFRRPRPATVSFARDIQPILARAVGIGWLSARAMRGHGPGKGGDFGRLVLDPDNPGATRSLYQLLGDPNDPVGKRLRRAIVKRVRNPEPAGDAEAIAQANFAFMPPLSGDEGDATQGTRYTWLTLLKTQYDNLQRWSRDDFQADWPINAPPPPSALEDLPAAEQPGALDRGTLEACVGGAFFPGIEMTYICRHPEIYAGPFRLKPDLPPGDITKHMALPWQADFYECNSDWWPAQRPDDVVTEYDYDQFAATFTHEEGRQQLANLFFVRRPWARGLGDRFLPAPGLNADPGETQPHFQRRLEAEWAVRRNHVGDLDMVNQWSRLGFVVPKTTAKGESIMVETERARYDGLKDRDYYHIMLNLDSYLDFLPKARELAETFLCQARKLQTSPDLDSDDDSRYLYPFIYDQATFEARLNQRYQQLLAEATAYSPASETVFTTREAVVERIRQLAPFNQLDGSWLRNITPAGPISEVHSLLFAIWMDEQGNGDPALNHANLYTDLLHQLGIYMEDINTRAYVDNPDLLDSAFTGPLFQLVVSQFSQDYFPEILGMTLYLEWEVLSLWPGIKRLESWGINAQFYRMHVGIDNAADGHGAKAKRAVELYLDQVRLEGGDEAVQKQWQRIWTGYVAFATTGDVQAELIYFLTHPPSLRERVVALIERKRRFAQYNHMDRMLGANFINDWFDDPDAWLDELEQSNVIVRGEPENSPFFRLTSYSGPMYKVFNDAELRLWTNYIRELGRAPDPAQAMTLLIDALRKRQMGTAGHQANRLTGPDPDRPGQSTTQTVGWWFDNQTASDLMRALANEENGWVVVGDALRSRFLTELANGDHPMAKALMEVVPGAGGKTGKQIAADWIDARCPIPANPAEAMVLLIVALHDRQLGTGGHQGNFLAGPDPDNPQQKVRQPVAWWFDAKFDTEPGLALMRALRNEENGWVTVGDATQSRFLSVLASGDHPMAKALSAVVAGTSGKTGRQIVTEWINAGCLLPGEAAPPRPAVPVSPLPAALALAAPAAPRLSTVGPEPLARQLPALPRPRRVRGMGAVH